MYIQRAKIKNIRSIENFEIEFKNPAGWHVLIGDNGSGKSTIIRSMALALTGRQFQGLREDWNEWLNKNPVKDKGKITVDLTIDRVSDTLKVYKESSNEEIPFELRLLNRDISFLRIDNLTEAEGVTYLNKGDEDEIKLDTQRSIFNKGGVDYEVKFLGFFSAAYGPYRRFQGGNFEKSELFKNPSYARLALHLSVFGEDVALTEATSWLVALFNTSTDPNFPEEQIESSRQLENIKKLINWEDNSDSFLPNKTKLKDVNSKGVFFKDGNGAIISVNQMSDGYRSILSMTFELIRQLIRVYGSEAVFKNIDKGEMFIDLPGVVLVDEIDAHLHPTWQTRIGQWFLKYFPKLQFIVTTHSPLVCRAAENGSIWRLAAPGSDEKSGEITGLDRERLIYGNVLDAYGTEVFGKNVSISVDSNEMLNRLSELNVKSMMGLISEKEEVELQELRAKLPTENKVPNPPIPKVMKAKAGANRTVRTQTEIINDLANRTGIKKSEIKDFFDALANLAVAEVKKSGEFTIPGFGKLVKSTHKVREGRNPVTGKSVKIPAKTTVKFRAGKSMKDSIK
ncbi:MAG TPA: AAA family ATPase [Pyrinomonadaceae bacterium]|nr:AAA family ATPase [Pyrinomonadaceae bacterium]